MENHSEEFTAEDKRIIDDIMKRPMIKINITDETAIPCKIINVKDLPSNINIHKDVKYGILADNIIAELGVVSASYVGIIIKKDISDNYKPFKLGHKLFNEYTDSDGEQCEIYVLDGMEEKIEFFPPVIFYDIANNGEDKTGYTDLTNDPRYT